VAVTIGPEVLVLCELVLVLELVEVVVVLVVVVEEFFWLVVTLVFLLVVLVVLVDLLLLVEEVFAADRLEVEVELDVCLLDVLVFLTASVRLVVELEVFLLDVLEVLLLDVLVVFNATLTELVLVVEDFVGIRLRSTFRNSTYGNKPNSRSSKSNGTERTEHDKERTNVQTQRM
jgi:hypothetical protein